MNENSDIDNSTVLQMNAQWTLNEIVMGRAVNSRTC